MNLKSKQQPEQSAAKAAVLRSSNSRNVTYTIFFDKTIDRNVKLCLSSKHVAGHKWAALSCIQNNMLFIDDKISNEWDLIEDETFDWSERQSREYRVLLHPKGKHYKKTKWCSVSLPKNLISVHQSIHSHTVSLTYEWSS